MHMGNFPSTLKKGKRKFSELLKTEGQGKGTGDPGHERTPGPSGRPPGRGRPLDYGGQRSPEPGPGKAAAGEAPGCPVTPA